ncbi:uncharacterized protein LOC128203494 [Mya arenaria]|uniref:uncharacterized protein LOC128203494 n=1 Tax=Mya arenaria TaxID=6604 RepID=UPI0022E17C7F|nr:uncharacterized protein LOC128203494 [Mya arenaria]XP_052760889.1 uncharacterized protein LOC128203494 [Mya arenaria]
MDIPVFKVRAEGSEKERTLHRNHLLLVEHQDEDSELDEVDETELEGRDASIIEEAHKMIDGAYDSDEESEGAGNTGLVFQHGDAYEPETCVNHDDSEASERVEVVDLGDEEISVISETDIANNFNLVISEDDLDVLEDSIAEKQQEETIDVLPTVQEVEEHRDERTADEATGGTEFEVVPEEDRKPKERPTPVPRRSDRVRKPPNRFGEYQMYSNQPVDRKLQALDTLMQSGVLRDVDSEMAYQLIGAIMNKK